MSEYTEQNHELAVNRPKRRLLWFIDKQWPSLSVDIKMGKQHLQGE